MRAWTYGGSRLKKLGTICFLEKVELCSYNYHFFLDLVEFWQYSNSAPQRFLVAYDYGIQVSVDFSFHVCRKESETWYARYILEGMDSSTRYGCRPSLEDYRVEDYRMSYWYSWHECGLVPPGSLLCDFLTVLCATKSGVRPFKKRQTLTLHLPFPTQSILRMVSSCYDIYSTACSKKQAIAIVLKTG